MIPLIITGLIPLLTMAMIAVGAIAFGRRRP